MSVAKELIESLKQFVSYKYSLENGSLSISCLNENSSFNMLISTNYFKLNVVSPKDKQAKLYESRGIAMEAVPSLLFVNQKDVRVLNTILETKTNNNNNVVYVGKYEVDQFTNGGLHVASESYDVNFDTEKPLLTSAISFNNFNSFKSMVLGERIFMKNHEHSIYGGNTSCLNLGDIETTRLSFVDKISSVVRFGDIVECNEFEKDKTILYNFNQKGTSKKSYKFAAGPELDSSSYREFDNSYDCISYIKEAYQNNYFDIAKSNLSTEEVNSFKNSDYVAIMSNSQYNPVRKDEYFVNLDKSENKIANVGIKL